MSIPSDWYVHVDGGNPTGPLPEGQLRFAIRQGRVPPTARVCRAGTSEWLPIGRSVFASEYGAFETTLIASHPSQAPAEEPKRRYDAVATLIGTVNLAAVLLVLFFFVPRSLDGGVRFSWSDFEKSPLLVVAPPALGLAVFVINRLPLPALVKAIAWFLGAIVPVALVIFTEPLPAQVLGAVGILLLPAFLFLRYLRFQRAPFRFLPIAAAVMIAVSYELPISARGDTPFSVALFAFEESPVLGGLSLGPLALCVITLLVSVIPPRGAPTASRVVAFLSLLYGPAVFIAIAIMSAVQRTPGSLLAATAKTEWLGSLVASATLFGFHAIASCGIAGTVEAILGPQPDLPPPAPVLAR